MQLAIACPGVRNPLDSMPHTAPHLDVVWRAFEDLSGIDAITAADVLAYCELLEIEEPTTRRTILRGVMTLQRELNRWKAEEHEKELQRAQNKR